MKTNSTLNQEKYLKFIILLALLLLGGQNKEKLNIFKVLMDTDYIVYNQLILFLKILIYKKIIKFPIVIVEFLLVVRKMILKDKFNICHLNIQDIKLSQILDQELISKEKVLKPFWNQSSLEMSKKLWLPTKIDYQDLGLNYSSGCFQNIKSNSWFSIERFQTMKKNFQKICYQSSMSFLPELMEVENTKKESKKKISKKKKTYKGVLKTRRIKIELNDEQFKILNKWAGICRKTYNIALESYNKKETTFDKLDHKFTLSTSNFFNESNKYLLECPKEVREIMIDKLKISLSNNFELLNTGKISKFNLKFKSKKNMNNIYHYQNQGFLKNLIKKELF
jgi:hypothetical protein